MFAYYYHPLDWLLSIWGDFVFCGSYRNIRFSIDLHTLILTFCEIIGCFLGCVLGNMSRTYFAGILYHDLIASGTCFVRSLIYSCALLSSLVSIAAKCSFILYMFTFLEGMAFVAIFAGLICCNPLNGWLLSTLLLVPQALIRVILFYYRSCCLKFSIISAIRRLPFCFVAVVAVLVLEFKWINPMFMILLDRF